MIGLNAGTDKTWKRIPKGSVGVELGVWKGESSVKFLKRASYLHLVDAWAVSAYDGSDEFDYRGGYFKRYSRIVGSTNPKDFQKYYERIYESVKEKMRNKPVTIHRCTTDQFFANFHEKVDWVYVDALHNFEGCLSDLRNSLKIIRPGGSIFGDDYGNKKGVIKAVDMFISETGLSFDNFYKNQFEIKIPV